MYYVFPNIDYEQEDRIGTHSAFNDLESALLFIKNEMETKSLPADYYTVMEGVIQVSIIVDNLKTSGSGRLNTLRYIAEKTRGVKHD